MYVDGPRNAIRLCVCVCVRVCHAVAQRAAAADRRWGGTGEVAQAGGDGGKDGGSVRVDVWRETRGDDTCVEWARVYSMYVEGDTWKRHVCIAYMWRGPVCGVRHVYRAVCDQGRRAGPVRRVAIAMDAVKWDGGGWKQGETGMG